MIDSDKDLWKYTGAVIVQPVIIYCLLTFGEGYRPATLWLAYAMSIELAVCSVVVFVCGLFWFYERGATLWYLAGVAVLLDVVALVVHRFYLADNFSDIETTLFVVLLYFAAGYATWRAIKFALALCYRKTLLLVAEVGAALRGELR